MGEIFEESRMTFCKTILSSETFKNLVLILLKHSSTCSPTKQMKETAMLSGYSFRMVQQTQQSFRIHISITTTAFNAPPQAPNMPLAADPNLDITGFLYRSLEFYVEELSYSGRFKPTVSTATPDVLRRRRQATSPGLGADTRDERPVDLPGVTTDAEHRQMPVHEQPAGGPQASGQTPVSNPWAQAFRALSGKPEYTRSVPGPGTILGVPDAGNTPGSNTTKLGVSGTLGSSAATYSPQLQPRVLRNRGTNPASTRTEET